MKITTDYPYIRAWGRLLGSYAYYVNAEMDRANHSDAPPTAIYRRDTEWAVAEDIQNPETQLVFNRICEDLGIPIPEYRHDDAR